MDSILVSAGSRDRLSASTEHGMAEICTMQVTLVCSVGELGLSRLLYKSAVEQSQMTSFMLLPFRDGAFQLL